MFVCMKRTTLVLEDSNYYGIKKLSQEERRDMTAVVNEFLREGLARRCAHKAVEPAPLPVFHLGVPRVDLADRDALEQAMEDR